MNVGKSITSTPFKHAVLDAILAQEVAVIGSKSTKVPAKPHPYFLCIDMCSGNGETNDDIPTASPLICARHCVGLSKKGIDTVLRLYEKQRNTFLALDKNVQDHTSLDRVGSPTTHSVFTKGNHLTVVLRHKDSRDVKIRAARNQAVFINCDPNSVHKLPIASVAKQLTPTTTFMVSMGCNVGGIKRLSVEERQKWYDYVDDLVDPMPTWHDALLVWLNPGQDQRQWAYLIRTPGKWVIRRKDMMKALTKKLKCSIRVASYRLDIDAFEDMQDELFLTKKELNR